jgi:hypothetical protein
MQVMRERIAAVEAEHNAQCIISWRFTAQNARVKVHDLYPTIENNLDWPPAKKMKRLGM